MAPRQRAVTSRERPDNYGLKYWIATDWKTAGGLTRYGGAGEYMWAGGAATVGVSATEFHTHTHAQ